MSSQWIWEPSSEFIRNTNVYKFMQRLGLSTLKEFLEFSQKDPEAFWRELDHEVNIEWFQPYEKILDTTQGVPWTRWFVGGKINIAHNCLDRHAKGDTANALACLWEGEDRNRRSVTFSELHMEVNQLANALRQLGLKKGDRVALCMPMIPEVLTILYACFKTGLVAVPIFTGFGARAISTRLDNCEARVVFTADGLRRRGQLLPLKEKLDQALLDSPSVERVIVYRYQNNPISCQQLRDIWWEDFLSAQPRECTSSALEAEDPAMILYTSGTTGQPKGCVHTHAGCLAQMTKEIYLAFDHQPTDRFFWVSDIGWMMGPWEIIGNHHFAGTIFLYDGAPDYPKADRFWEIIDQHKITVFGISPTAIRLLMRQENPTPRNFDLDSLRLLGSTGEPWDETSYLWFFKEIGKERCPIINISGGTEIAGCFLLPLPIQPLKPCTLGGPAPGMATEVFDETGLPIRGKKGYLVCTKPFPSMTRGLWKDPQGYLDIYWSRWNNVWYHGDWASVDEDGCWYLHGRADETLNVAGRKVGPAEIEESLIEHASISEASVIGVPDEVKGEAIVTFVVLADGFKTSDALTKKLETHLVRALGPPFRPRAIHVVPALPKTQSGKIIRRLIRRAYLEQPLGDLTTVDNPDLFSHLHRSNL